MFRKLHSGLAVSQREDPFLEYSSPSSMGDLALAWISFGGMMLCSSF